MLIRDFINFFAKINQHFFKKML